MHVMQQPNSRVIVVTREACEKCLTLHRVLMEAAKAALRIYLLMSWCTSSRNRYVSTTRSHIEEAHDAYAQAAF